MGHLTTLIVLMYSISVTLAQTLDPINNFCRRFSHQTAFIDNKLYIDGGYVNYGGAIDSSTVNYTNTFLLYADTTSVNEVNFPVEYNNLTKPANVPSVAGGTLWTDEVNKVFYLFGGEYNWTSTVPSPSNLWFYDTAYNSWNTTATDPSVGQISRNAYGSSAVDPNKGVGYYYGGWKSNATSQGFSSQQTAQSGLVSYDFIHNRWRNSTFIDDTPRAEGALFYIPASDAGLLIYFGGVQQSANGSMTGVPLNTIYVYDIASEKSYSQQTRSRYWPTSRRRFCGGVTWPDDRSSYNIYLYGGLPDQQGLGYGDVWVLSLPSFTWTALYQPSSDPKAHHSLSCNVVNQGQMIIMGGYFPNSSDTTCDAQSSWGMHNLNLGANDVFQAFWYQYLPNITTYQLPPNLTQVIGGSKTGGATLVTPSGDFDNADLHVYFTRLATTGTRTATRSFPTAPTATQTYPPNPSTNVGAIAGGVVGGIAALSIIAALVFFCLRRRARRRANNGSTSVDALPGEPERITEASADAGSVRSVRHKYNSTTASSYLSPSQRQTPVSSPEMRQSVWSSQIQPQTYYPPPPQAQQFYPAPPSPQTYDRISTSQEMPSSRTPQGIQELPHIRSPPNDPRWL